MNLKRKCIGGGYLRYRSFDEVPRRLSFTRQKITDIGHGDDWGLPRLRGAIRRLANPIERYLNKQVGRPWSEVQAELDARCRKLQTTAELREYARKRVFSQVVSAGKWAAGNYRRSIWSRACDVLFVDPNSGILRRHRFAE